MSDLDKKLEEIVSETIWDYCLAEDTGYGIPKVVGQEKATRIIADGVKQAFIDAGWRHDGFTDAVEHIYKKKSEGVQPTWVRIAGCEFMTGQEWYDRFDDEMCKVSPMWRYGGNGFNEVASTREAAKKAAGIE